MRNLSKIWMLLLAFVLCIPLNGVAQTGQGWSGSGSGTESDPYRILDASDLDQVRNFLGQSGVYFKLMDDIDIASWIRDNNPTEGWLPIGISSSPFQGVLDGNGKTISGLMINRGETDNVGLFGCVSGATLKNFTLNGTTIVGGNATGALIGKANGATISGLDVTFTSVTGRNCTGGLIGHGDSKAVSITSCKQSGNVQGAQTVGGIIGYSTSNLTIKSTSSQSTVEIIEGLGAGTSVGGLIGYSKSTVSATTCNHYGNVSGGDGTGGLIGRATSTVSFTTCNNEGNVSGGKYVGGAIGLCDKVTLTKCSHVGNVNGNQSVGGLIGHKAESTKRLIIDNSFALGDITGEGNTGGLVGCMLAVNTQHYLNSNYTNAVNSIKYVTIEDTYKYSLNSQLNNTKENKYYNILGIDRYRSDQGIMVYGYKCGSSSSNVKVAKSTTSLLEGDNSSIAGYIVIKNDGKSNSYEFGTSYYKHIVIPDNTNFHSYTFDGKNQISNSYFNGKLVGTDNVGGIVGIAQTADITKNYVSASVSGKTNVGGIAGKLDIGTSYSGNSTITSNIAINTIINASASDAGRIYGSIGSDWTVGSLGSAETNKAVLSTEVSINGVAQKITESAQQGNTIGVATIKKKATYQGVGWDLTTDWNILETESYPYKSWQTVPPIILNGASSGSTTITGKCADNGTVYIEIGSKTFTATISGNSWSATVDPLQAGTEIKVYAKEASKIRSYSTIAYVEYIGSGTEADPYQVCTVEDLAGMNGNYYYKLMNDLDLTSWISKNNPTNGWIPLGRNASVAAHFDGNNHTISGLWTNTTEDYTGLFGNASNATIENLKVTVADGKSVKGGAYTAILLGKGTSVTITNCSVNGNVIGGNNSASLIGEITSGKIQKASTIGSVTGTTNVGGIAGKSNADISECQSVSLVKTTSTDAYAGGIVGYSTATISESVSKGSVTAEKAGTYAGGIAGYIESGSITNCYSTATIIGTAYVGGIAGYNKTQITNCYASGDLKCTGWGAGIVGYNDGSNAVTKQCIALSQKIELTESNGTAKRIIGGYKNGAPDPQKTDNYALNEMILSVNGVPQTISDNMLNGTSKSSSELKQSSLLSGLGWDLEKIWVCNDGQSYAYLSWEKDMVSVTEIALDKTSLTIEEGTSSTLTASVMPLNAQNKNLEWKSSNTNVATVTDGIIKAVGVGTANITVVSTDGSNITATCKVTVTAKGNKPNDDVEPSTDLASLSITTYIPNLVVRQGETFSLPINLKNTKENVVGFQFDLQLPEGVSLTRNSRGKITAPVFNVAADRTSTEYHTVSASEQEDGSVRVLCYSNANEIILGNDGTVCDFTATLSKDMLASDYNIIMKNVIVTTEDLKQTKIERLVSILSIPSFTIGDANGDEEINVTDIAATASYILGSTPTGFVEKAADVNEDNEINVTDIAGIANIILTGASNKAKALKSKAKANSKSTSPSLEVVPFTVKSGVNDMNVALDLIGEVDDEFVGFQCDIYFPEGISWKLNSRKKATAPAFNAEADRTSSEYHTASAAIQSDGSVRVLCYSNSNEVILGKDGTVLDLPIVFEKGLADGVYQVNIKNVVLTHNDITQTKIDEYKFSVIVGTPELANINIYGDINTKAISAINKALGNSSTLMSIDMSEALHISDKQAFEMSNPNTLIYIAEGGNIANTKNVVKGDICGIYEVTEGFSATISKPFIAESALYTRPLTSNWGTICLPFVLESDNNVQYYRLVSVGPDRMSFAPVNSIEAGEPAVFKSLSDALTINASDVMVMDGDKEKTTNAQGWIIKGTYSSFNNDPEESWNDIYYISDNKFWYANKTFSVAAFRGWFESSKSSNAKSLVYSITDNDDTATGVNYIENENGTVDIIFDLSGKKLSTPKNGVNIINGQKIRIK